MGIPVTGTDVSGGSGGTPTNTFGLWGDSSSGVGVIGTTSATGKAGVEGFNVGIDRQGGGVGVFGFSHITHGVKGESFGEAGVYGFAPSSIGLLAEGGDIGLHAKAIQSAVGIGHIGLLAESIGTDNQVITDAYIAVHTTGSAGYGGIFGGPVVVGGAFQAEKIYSSVKFFRIDHPNDPANRYLNHSSVESPDMKNIYDGVTLLDENGEAEVILPAWFDGLNIDFRYQLTCIGSHAPVFIAREIDNNRFTIAGGMPRMKISWQVKGSRHDAYAKANRLPVAQDKAADERGRYRHPEVFGEPDERSIMHGLREQLSTNRQTAT